jgi:hypothetical protein
MDLKTFYCFGRYLDTYLHDNIVRLGQLYARLAFLRHAKAGAVIIKSLREMSYVI